MSGLGDRLRERSRRRQLGWLLAVAAEVALLAGAVWVPLRPVLSD